MVSTQKFLCKIIDSNLDMANRMPFPPLKLRLAGQSLNTEGLLSAGTSVNTLPHELFERLGLIWKN